MQFVRTLYCKLPTNGKQLPALPHEAVPGTEPQPQRWEARMLPLCHRGPEKKNIITKLSNMSGLEIHGRKHYHKTSPHA